MRTGSRRLVGRLRGIDSTDLMLFGGIALLALGLAWIYPPLGPIVAGATLATIGWQLAKAPLEERPRRQLISTISTVPGETDEELYG